MSTPSSDTAAMRQIIRALKAADHQLLTAAAAALTILSPAHADQSTPTPVAGRGVVVVGDSLTVQANRWGWLPDRWTVDGRGGRPVAELPGCLEGNLEGHGQQPRVLVIALGQNESPDWERADYRRAVNSVPDTTSVLMVDTYRDPAIFGDERAAVQARYSRWMARIAAHQPNVTVVPWRAAVRAGDVTLVDGSHPDRAGARYRARMTVAAVRAVR